MIQNCGTMLNLIQRAEKIGYVIVSMEYAYAKKPEETIREQRGMSEVLSSIAKCSAWVNGIFSKEAVYIQQIGLKNEEADYWYDLNVANGLVYEILRPERTPPKQDKVLGLDPSFVSTRAESGR